MIFNNGNFITTFFAITGKNNFRLQASGGNCRPEKPEA